VLKALVIKVWAVGRLERKLRDHYGLIRSNKDAFSTSICSLKSRHIKIDWQINLPVYFYMSGLFRFQRKNASYSPDFSLHLCDLPLKKSSQYLWLSVP